LECKNAESLEVCCFGIYRTFRLDSCTQHSKARGREWTQGSEVNERQHSKRRGPPRSVKGTLSFSWRT
jgi:hypothetical protein